MTLECAPRDLGSTAPPRPALRLGGSGHLRRARRPALRRAATRSGVERSLAAGHRHRPVALGSPSLHVILAFPGTAGIRYLARLPLRLTLLGREDPAFHARYPA